MLYQALQNINAVIKSRFLENYLQNYAFIKWGEPEAKFIKIFANKNAYAFDIGSNVGEYSSIMRRYFSRVIAVDANEKCCTHLKERLGSSVDIFNIALSSEEGTLALHIPLSENGMSGCATLESKIVSGQPTSVVKVSVKKLDSFYHTYSPIAFIKIDVEGHEYKVLQGAELVIENHKPSFLIEIEHRHNAESFNNVVNFLEQRGYTGFFIDKSQVLPISAFNKDLHQDVEVLFGRKKNGLSYINNFFFTTQPDMIESIKQALA